ncbi:MAG: hypothetical protein ABR521_13340 [Gaiellaceae bacterium]
MRRVFLEGYSFSSGLRESVRRQYEPELSREQLTLVLEGLRNWFLACLCSGRRTLGMPSRAVDDAWHDFILMSRAYHTFCDEVFGRYLHHTPDFEMAEPMPGALAKTLSVLEKYRLDHPPHVPSTPGVPFLFAVDSLVGVEDGYEWTPERIAELRRGEGGTSGGGSCGSGEGSGSSCGGGSCGGGGCGGGG